jgi:hypothetical protein
MMERLSEKLNDYLGQWVVVTYNLGRDIEIVASELIEVSQEALKLKGFRWIQFDKIKSISCQGKLIYEKK